MSYTVEDVMKTDVITIDANPQRARWDALPH
jgi:hypothetical protein